MALYYIHGYESNCETAKSKLAISLGANCIHYTNRDLENGNIFELIKDIKDDDSVIGSSLGGFLSLYVPARRKFLLNPLIDPRKMLELGNYSVFVNTVLKRKIDYEHSEIYSFIGKNDKVLNHDINFFYKISKELFVLDDDHRFTEKRDFVFYLIERILSDLE